MTRFWLDESSKEVLGGTLEGSGRFTAQDELHAEIRWLDGWFEPDPQGRPAPGMLGGMTERACAFEVFSAAPSIEAAVRCLGKLITAYERERRRGWPPGADLPPMWVVCGGRPESVLRDFAMAELEGWGDGVCRMTAAALPLHVVITSELPRDRYTLMLRLMGTGKTLRGALEDLRRLPADAWERQSTMRAMDVLRSRVPDAVSTDLDEEAIIMTASELYEQVKDAGRVEGERRLIMRQLERRFRPLADDVRDRVQRATAAELEVWADRVLTAKSVDEVFAVN